MIATEDLIRQLASGVRPVARGAGLRRLLAGIAAGAAVSLAGIAAWSGPPLQSVQYTGAAAFTMKTAFAVAMFAIAAMLLFRAGRPGSELGRRWLWLLVPPALVAVSAVMELSMTLPQYRTEKWLGSTSQTCLLTITLLSLPVFVGLSWAFRQLAPTRLRLAGLLAGLTAGSAAAVLYALYCPETTATFLLSWYSLGILTAGLVGLVFGPRLLRW